MKKLVLRVFIGFVAFKIERPPPRILNSAALKPIIFPAFETKERKQGVDGSHTR